VNAELKSVMQARRSLEKVRVKLLRPTVKSLDSSASDLMTAVDSLRRLELDLSSRDWRGGGSERALEIEVQAMRNELQNVTVLFESAGNFHQGWARLASTMTDDTANYSAKGKSGKPIPIDSARLVLHV
jgi:hypothetical protein